MRGRRKEHARFVSALALDVALLAVRVNVYQREGRAAVAVVRFDGDYVLVVLRANLQLGDGSGVVAFTFQLFGSLGVFVVVVDIDVATVFLRVALEDLAVLSQFVAIEVDDFAGSIVGVVFDDHQLKAERFSENSDIDRIGVFLIVPESRPRIERQPSSSGVGIIANVQVTHGTAHVKFFVLPTVAILGLGGEAGDCDEDAESYRESYRE
jgi:hypothetical protein